MIPLIIHIKNFLSYGPETQIIDFRPYHLISLAGKNGHGKSALLDAITWAVWGQARKSSGNSKPDSGLLHLGQKHMMVILEFEVNGNTYRVRREHLNTQSKPFTTLDFGIMHADGKLVPLTDKTIKDTQEKIERTIGITYDSFSNSTFLRQGQSNEFSKKSPKERKEILAQILQLQQFDRHKKIALAHTRKLQQDYQTKLHIQQRIISELEKISSQLAQHSNLEQDIEQNHATLQATQNQCLLIKQQLEHMLTKQNELRFFEQQRNQALENIKQITTQIKTVEQKLHQSIDPKEYQGLLARQHETSEKIVVLQQELDQKNLLSDQLALAKEKLSVTLGQIQADFQTQSQALALDCATNNEKLKQITRLILALQEQLKVTQDRYHKKNQSAKQLQALATQLSQANIEHQKIQDLYDHSKQKYQQICMQGTYLKQHIKKLQDDYQLLHGNQHHACLTCKQDLTVDQHATIITTIEKEIFDAKAEIESLKKEAHELKQELQQHQNMLVTTQQKQQEYLQVQAQLQHEAETQQLLLDQIKQDEQNIKNHQEEQQLIQNKLSILQQKSATLQQAYDQQTQNPDIVSQNVAIKKFQEEIAQIQQHHVPAYQQAQQDLMLIKKQLSQYSTPATMVQDQAKLDQLSGQLNILQGQLEETVDKITLIQTQLVGLNDLGQQEKIQEDHITTLRKHHQELLILQSSVDQKIKEQKKLERELEQLVHEIKTIHQEISDYQEVARALGKDGIQALLIEQAIPEIEHETNIILSRLTNNQTQIFIESLKDLKKGGSKETLDIKISDQFGLRDYEMFSGGEAFRIDFALRIGISKLLARRAGTTLQTIFIDEGFGSQDEEGLGLMMDNIHKIQQDFAKIIIVSHLPEMKEHFPVQFMVEKKRSGSCISIMHQG